MKVSYAYISTAPIRHLLPTDAFFASNILQSAKYASSALYISAARCIIPAYGDIYYSQLLLTHVQNQPTKPSVEAT